MKWRSCTLLKLLSISTFLDEKMGGSYSDEVSVVDILIEKIPSHKKCSHSEVWHLDSQVERGNIWLAWL